MSQLASRSRATPSKPGVFAVLWRLAIYIVNDTLGIASLRRATLISASLTALLGLPLFASAIEKVVSAAVLESLGKSGELLPALLTFALLAGAFLFVLLVTLQLWRGDLHSLDDHDEDEVFAKVGLLLPCSLPPDPSWMRELAAMPPDERLRLAGSRPQARWLELLVRALEVHGRIVERVVLLVDFDLYDTEELRDALETLVRETVRGVEDREVTKDPEIRLSRIDDPNHAEGLRATASGEIRRLEELGLSIAEIGVQVTTGTSAMSIGLALAATVHRVEVQYFPQHRDYSVEPRPMGVGTLRGAIGPLPIRIQTTGARRRLEDALRASA